MTKYLTNTNELTLIADAIRSKTRTSSSLSFPDGFITALNNMPSEPTLQSINVIPSEVTQAFQPAESFDAIGTVFVNAISSDYVGSVIPRRGANNIVINNATMTAPYGYYSESITQLFPVGSAYISNSTIDVTTDIYTQHHGGNITAFVEASFYITPTFNSGYITDVGSGQITISGRSIFQLPSQAAATFTPSAQSYLAINSGKYVIGDVVLNAISADYVGSAIPRLAAQSYTPGISSMYIPAGYYLEGAQTILGDDNLIASNIKSGVSIFNIQGTYTGAGEETLYSLECSIVKMGATALRDYYYSTYSQLIYSNPRISVVGSYAFFSQSINYLSLPNVVEIQDHAFDYAALRELDCPACVSIGDCAFRANTNLSKISLPLCTQIGTSAFVICPLREINMPSLSIVASYAFQGCSSLSTINLPVCTRIEMSAFSWCSRLTTVSLPVCSYIGSFAFWSTSINGTLDLPMAEIIDYCAFEKCRIVSLNIPNVTEIRGNAFLSNAYLTTICAPMLEIAPSAFVSCTSLQSAILPACVSLYYTFSFCINLSLVDLPVCKTIDSMAFNNAYSLKICSIPMVESIGSSAFAGCSSLESIAAPECTVIHVNAFGGCSSLSDVYFPKLETISQQAFVRCVGFTSITANMFPVCKKIYMSAFLSAQNLSYIEFPACEEIYNYAFNSCPNLKTVSLPNLSYITSYAFAGTAIKNLYLPACTRIDSLVLSTLERLEIPAFTGINNTQIAGSYCSLLSYVYVPNLEIASFRMFEYMSYVSELSLPVCSFISSYAFRYCYRLLSLYLTSTSVVSLGTPVNTAFSNTPMNGYTTYTNGLHGYVYVPMSLLSAYKSALYWSTISNYIVGIEEGE